MQVLKSDLLVVTFIDYGLLNPESVTVVRNLKSQSQSACRAPSVHCYVYLPVNMFLVAFTRLYNQLCPSVGRSVGRLVGWSLFTFFIRFILSD